MWWHIKSKENIFMYSNYCRHSLLCKKHFVCGCYELSMSINIVQCSLHKLKKTANRLVTRIHNSLLFPKWYSNITQPTTFSCYEFASDFQPWSNWGLSHGADCFFIIPEIIQTLKWHAHSDPLTNCPCDNCSQ